MPGRISRGRGYAWEHKLALLVNSLENWHCRRLGGSSANMPDLLCVNSSISTIIATECKSLMSKKKGLVSLYVPHDQIVRCITMVEIFELYRHKEVVLSFKFGHGYKNTYFFQVHDNLWTEIKSAKNVITSCSNNGVCRMKIHTPDESVITTPLIRRSSLLSG